MTTSLELAQPGEVEKAHFLATLWIAKPTSWLAT